jgi:hypothetical protein
MTVAEFLPPDELVRGAGVQNPVLEIRQQFKSAKRTVSDWLGLPAGAPQHLSQNHKIKQSIG